MALPLAKSKNRSKREDEEGDEEDEKEKEKGKGRGRAHHCTTGDGRHAEERDSGPRLASCGAQAFAGHKVKFCIRGCFEVGCRTFT